MPNTICSVQSCEVLMNEKSARGMCARHYQYWLRTGSPVRLCPTCGETPTSSFTKYCSDLCKPRCSVEGCDGPVRKRGWCASHYAQYARTGVEPVPFTWKWNDLVPCLNCGAEVEKPKHRRFCTDNCHMAYRLHGGPRPTSTDCVVCGIAIDLNARGKRGQRRNSSVKLCRPCKQDYGKYKMSARELAMRDGTECSLCGLPVDMTLTRSDGLDCPSVDHVRPRSHGGTHDPDNLALAHLRCNMAKGDRVPR